MTDPRRPVAYIRRSVSTKSDPGDISREFQTEAVRRQAGNAPDLVILDGDWGRSAATDKTGARLAFLDMLTMIERGEVSMVCAYSADRLARSVEWSARLLNACRRAGVTIVTQEGRFAPDDDGASDLFNFRAVVNESALRQMEKKAKAAMERRRARGDRLGHPIYGTRHVKRDGRIVREPNPDQPIEPILAAYEDAGRKVASAGALLEQRGILSPRGKARWSTSALARILEFHAPGMLPHRTATGRRHPAQAALASLLRCPSCNAFLTPNKTRGQYYCRFGASSRKKDPTSHPRYAVREVDILPWIKAEAARLRIPDDLTVTLDGLEDQRKAINERRERARELYLAGEIDKGRWDNERSRAESELDTVGMREAAIAGDLPRAVDWTWEPETIAEVLRALWRFVELDANLQTIRAEWNVPEWRMD